MSNITRHSPPFTIDDVIAMKPCPECKHTEGHVVASETMHAAGVRCWECGRHCGWLPKWKFAA